MNSCRSRFKSVAILLSTYNGSKYIDTQLDSLFAQQLDDNYHVDIIVRDDGSTDDTVLKLLQYEAKGQIRLIQGSNVGVVASFVELIDLIGNDYDYVALCDQDDRWHTGKIRRAIQAIDLKDCNLPVLYASEYVFCDENLNKVANSHLCKNGVSFYKLLYENVISGNTIVINRALHGLLSGRGKEHVYCHDWWIALVASSLGEVIFDRDYYSLDYRRLGDNASATGRGRGAILKNRVRRFVHGDGLDCVTGQLVKLVQEYEDLLPIQYAEDLSLFLHSNRFKKVFFPKRLRQTVAGEVCVRLLFLLGRL